MGIIRISLRLPPLRNSLIRFLLGGNMNIKINNINEDDIKNIAFIKAILIKNCIENLDINYRDKEKLKKEILEYLKTHD